MIERETTDYHNVKRKYRDKNSEKNSNNQKDSLLPVSTRGLQFTSYQCANLF
jgi:hypothetical protein